MTTQHFFSTAWSWSPCVLAACAAILAAYCMHSGFRFHRKTGWILAGTLLLFLTLASPIDALADGYLFSAHMLQHILLLLVVPPLLLLGLPPPPVPDSFQVDRWKWVNWILRHPLVTWLLGVGGMWFWHIPALCNAAVSNAWIHRLQYISLLAMGFAFWWPIFGPRQKQRLPPPVGILYLFSACLGCTVLGIIITFAPVEVCSVYLHPVDRLGILRLIQNQWGLTPSKDQQLGGLLMWVPACLIYSVGIIGLLFRWYGRDETPVPEPPSQNTHAGKPYGT